MIQTFIEKNTRLLQVYCIAARIIGWLILFMGSLGILTLLINQYQAGWEQSVAVADPLALLQRSWYRLMVTGLISLGVAQFIRYLYDCKYRPGWLIRCGDKILYIFIFFVVWHMTGMTVLYFSRDDIANPAVWLLNIIPMLLINLAKILALLGLAQILKRAMPVIEESRTLV